MLGRQVGTSLLRLPRCARLPIRSLPYQQAQYDLAIRTLAPSSQRFYAETTSRPGRPKKAVGEPSRPVKRAVKRAAKSPKEDAATKQVKAKKATAQTKKRKAAAKPKAKPKPKKEVSPEVLAKRKAKKAADAKKATIVELKKLALDPPHLRKTDTWNEFRAERIRGSTAGVADRKSRNEVFSEQMRRIKEEYRNMTPAEQEHYNHLAHAAKDKQAAEYKQWVESHTAEEIATANKARRSLRLKLSGNKAGLTKWGKLIKDERAVKRPTGAFAQFTSNRWASGDFKGISVGDAAKLCGQEWKALSESEKKRYTDIYKQDAGRFNDEYNTVYGHPPPHLLGQEAQAAAAAA